MSQGRKIMAEWVVEALRELGGEAPILEIARSIWTRHEAEIRAAGDLLYEWQYELRWAGDALRREGILQTAQELPRGTWGLAYDPDAPDDLCDICYSSEVNVNRTTYCGKTIGIECGCEDRCDGTCGNADCDECAANVAAEASDS